jgi:hypothetical protein
LKKNGILGEFDTFDIKAVYVNPDLIWRKDLDDNEEYTNKIRALFELNKQFKEQEENGK